MLISYFFNLELLHKSNKPTPVQIAISAILKTGLKKVKYLLPKNGNHSGK